MTRKLPGHRAGGGQRCRHQPPPTHSCACPWNGSLEGLSAPLPQSLLLPGPQGGTFSRLDLLFSSPVPPGPCFAPTAACMHASCSHHHHLHSVEAHVQTTHPCIILVRLHLYEKAFIFKWFFLLLVFFLIFALEVYLIPLA